MVKQNLFCQNLQKRLIFQILSWSCSTLVYLETSTVNSDASQVGLKSMAVCLRQEKLCWQNGSDAASRGCVACHIALWLVESLGSFKGFTSNLPTTCTQHSQRALGLGATLPLYDTQVGSSLSLSLWRLQSTVCTEWVRPPQRHTCSPAPAEISMAFFMRWANTTQPG